MDGPASGEVGSGADGGRAPDGPQTGERLQKLLAKAGLGSRRTCEQLVIEGRVTVNGAPAQVGRRADPAVDLVALDGIPVPVREDEVYYLLNKPAGAICSASDPRGRPTVLDLVPSSPRVFSVGRLDVSSEGLLILTNDGELAYQLTHPRFGVDKEYLVETEGELSKEAVRRLRNGVQLADGVTAPCKVTQVAAAAARIVIHEGRNRQVRRMCDAVGHPVKRLVRVRIGPVADQSLAPGEWRRLSTQEVRQLWGVAMAAPDGPEPGPGGVRSTTGRG